MAKKDAAPYLRAPQPWLPRLYLPRGFQGLIFLFFYLIVWAMALALWFLIAGLIFVVNLIIYAALTRKANRSSRPVRPPIAKVQPPGGGQVESKVAPVANQAEPVLAPVVASPADGGAATPGDWIPARVTQSWIEMHAPSMSAEQRSQFLAILRDRSWTEAEISKRVYPHFNHA